MITETERGEFLRDSRSQRNCLEESVRRVRPDEEETRVEAVVLAWWKSCRKQYGVQGGNEGLADEETIHVYTTHIRPSKPLTVGGRVKLLALPKAAPTAPSASLQDFKAYDPHVMGVVGGIEEGDKEGWVKATIHNRCRGNTVRTVELEILYVPNETARIATLKDTWNSSGWRLVRLPMECIAHLGDTGRLGHLGRRTRGSDGARETRSGDGTRCGDETQSMDGMRSGNGTRDGNGARSGDGTQDADGVRNGGRARAGGSDGGGRRDEIRYMEEDGERRGSTDRREGGCRDVNSARNAETCGAEECGLRPPPGKAGGRTGRFWNVMETRVRKEEATRGLEGALKLHMWLRYDWAK